MWPLPLKRKNNLIKLLPLLILFAASGCNKKTPCADNSDCKFTRVCINHFCTNPPETHDTDNRDDTSYIDITDNTDNIDTPRPDEIIFTDSFADSFTDTIVDPTEPDVIDLVETEPDEEVLIIYVDHRTQATNPDGLSWETAFPGILEGLNEAAQYALSNQEIGVEIWVVRGVYSIYQNDSQDSLQMVDRVHLYGGFIGNETARNQRDWSIGTILTGYDSRIDDRVEHVVRGADNATLDGFTITEGRAQNRGNAVDSSGGGMLNVNASPVIANCTFTNNSAINGGGMLNESSSPTITNCTFIENTASNGSGGGLANTSSSHPVIKNSSFISNYTQLHGGGLFNGSRSSPTVTNCIFRENSASAGGGMYNGTNSSPTVINALFDRNNSDFGGGMSSYTGHPIIINSTFAGHTGSSSVTFSNSGTIYNSILWNETQTEIEGSPEIFYSTIKGGYSGTGNIAQDPLLTRPAEGDFTLLADSPCIDAADGDQAPEKDFVGNSRIDAPNVPNTGTGSFNYVDIGAYEYIP